MKLTGRQKKYIKKKYRKVSVSKLSSTLEIPQKLIIEFLGGKLNKKTAPKLPIKEYLIKNKNFLFFTLLLTFLVYFYSLFGEFVSADDIPVLNDPAVFNLDQALKSGNLNYIIFSILINIFGPNAFVLHLRSVLFHLFSVFLVFIFSYQLFDKRISFFTTLLFALHPVNTEAVAWISGSGYLLNTIFMLSSLIFYKLFIDFKKNNPFRGKKYLYISLGIYTLSLLLLQSPWLLVLVPVIFIIDWFFEGRKYTWSYYLVPALVFLVFFVPNMLGSRVNDLSVMSPFQTSESVSFLERIPYSIYSMTRLLVFPFVLSIFNEGNAISQPYFIWMILVSIAYFGLVIFSCFKNIKITGLLLIILISVAPVFSPKIIAFFMAERYLYFGSVFFSMMIACLLVGLEKKIKVKNVSFWAISIILLLFSARVLTRTLDWHSSKTLWLATVKVSPNSARVYNNLGDVYGKEGNTELEIESFKKAIELNPNYADAMFNLGLTYLRNGQYKEGEQFIEKAGKIKPSLYEYGQTVLEKYLKN